jgi:putative transposase
MNKSQYNPEIHHRRSIRLKGHDYAGGGLYFVTICAHRDAGNIFAADDVREMVAKEWESVGASLVGAGNMGGHETRPYVVMPDHFHALIQIPRGDKSLGDLIGAFKSRVVHEYIIGVKAGKWPRFQEKIWHRNYYEMIVRTPEAEKKITEYIRMNPWRCVQNFGGGLRGMGNPALWNTDKLGVLCSRNAPKPKSIPKAAAYFSGFHSPMEKEILTKLLEHKRSIIWCPAWGLNGKLNPQVLEALEDNRMLILEMRNQEGDLAAAEQRNRFVLEHADKLWLPHINPGGMTDRLAKEMQAQEKILNQGTH